MMVLRPRPSAFIAAPWALLAVTAVVGIDAHAGNGIEPRTPVLWTDAACMTIFDKATQATGHFTYEIPYEDTELTSDEVDDSRTHQFIAFCRQRSVQDYPPFWLTQDDVDRAAANGLIDATTVSPDEIVDTNDAWSDCVLRVTADDARVPITFAAAAQGVDWPLADVPVGSYAIDGFTFEPPVNMWSPRPGVVKIIDSAAGMDGGPAAALVNDELILYRGQVAMLEGCLDAMDGTTVTGSWSLALPEPTWVPFVSDAPVDGESFVIEFPAPAEIAGKTAIVKLAFTDPMGRTYEAHLRDVVTGLDGADPEACDDESGSFILPPGCATTSSGGDESATSSESTSDTSSSATPPANDDAAGGCGCRSGSSPSSGLLLGAWLLSRRRQRGRAR